MQWSDVPAAPDGKGGEGVRRTVLLLAMVGGAVLAWPLPASAQWVVSATGSGAAQAATVNGGNAPSATASGRTVQLSWSATTLSNGQAVAGYIVKRYDATGTVTQVIVSGTCASTVSGTSCSETAVPPGTWKYSVTPTQNNWVGAESAKTSVAVGTPSLTLSPSIVKSGTTLTGTISNFIDGESIQFRRDSTGGPVLSGTVNGTATPAAVPAGGTASVTVVIPAGTSEGSHTVYAVASPSGENAGATVTVDDTTPPAPSITGGPANPTNSTTASFTFTDTEAGVNFQCQLDGGGFSSCTSPHTYTGLTQGSHTFQVRAVDAAGNTSGATSSTWTIDTTAPTATVTFPVAGTSYNNGGYRAGCGTASTDDICGTAADTGGAGLSAVQISIQRVSTGNYWNGTSFGSATPVLFTPTGTTSWSYGFARTNFPADGDYLVLATATDGAGNTGIATSTFTMDRTVPSGSDVQTANASSGTSGRPEVGDTITFTYSETMKSTSILAGWDGSSTNVVVRINDGGLFANDTMQVWNASNGSQTALGSVNLGDTAYAPLLTNLTFGASGTPSTMSLSGSTITVVLGTASSSPGTGGSGTMVWSPSATATDLAGNACSTSTVNESGGGDREF